MENEINMYECLFMLQITQFTQQIVLNSLKFTASGFFSIDNTLTGKVYIFNLFL